MKKPVVLCFLALVSLLFALFPMPPPASAGTTGGPPEYEIMTLRLPGMILKVASGNADSDAKTDLFLFHKPAKESYEKFCSIYLQGEGDFKADRQVQIPLGEGISAFDIKDIDSDGMDELCGFDADGLIVFQWHSGSSVESGRLLKYQTVLPKISRGIVAVNWIADVNSDDRMDVLLPGTDGMRLFLMANDFSLVESHVFEFEQAMSVTDESGQNYVVYRLPRIEFSDFDKDGYTDLGSFDRERMDFFLTDGARTPARHKTAPLIREFTKDFIASAEFEDLNADGVPDAVLVLLSQKKNLQSEVRVYFGDEGFSYGNRPTHVYSGDSRLILPVFLDATGDGKMEMLLQDINVGIGFFLNYFLANRIRVDTALRMLSQDGRYEDSPAVRRAIYIRVSDSGTEPARGAGDFNGDGLDDLVVGTSENRLSFFLSNKQTILPKEPTFELSVPAFGNMTTMDMNADDRADIIILYPQESMKGIATVLLSR